ncbi:hypothetical protein DFJ74DRAFT_768591 [Hyaloraphidium curvatum]|nr:hypothetical protein DFJ74DRAFT_768591 [Hyaloraphidium curvatum]
MEPRALAEALSSSSVLASLNALPATIAAALGLDCSPTFAVLVLATVFAAVVFFATRFVRGARVRTVAAEKAPHAPEPAVVKSAQVVPEEIAELSHAPPTSETPLFAPVPELTSLPPEILATIVSHAFDGLRSDETETRRAAFVHRIAVESTCRLLRSVAAGIDWFAPDGFACAVEFENLFPCMEGRDKTTAARWMDVYHALELFFRSQPARFRSIRRLRFEVPLFPGFATMFGDGVLAQGHKLKQLCLHSCHPELLTLLSRPGWKLDKLCLGYVVGREKHPQGSATEIGRMLVILGPGIDTFHFAFSPLKKRGDDDADGSDIEPDENTKARLSELLHTVSAATDKMKALKRLSLDGADVVIKTEIDSLIAALTKLETLVVKSTRVLLGDRPAIYENLRRLSITNSICTCGFRHSDDPGEMFLMPSLLDDPATPVMFPNLAELAILGSGDANLAQIRRHCPVLECLRLVLYSNAVESWLEQGGSPDLEAIFANGHFRVGIFNMVVPDRVESGEYHPAAFVFLDVQCRLLSQGKAAIGWIIGTDIDKTPKCFLEVFKDETGQDMTEELHNVIEEVASQFSEGGDEDEDTF